MHSKPTEEPKAKEEPIAEAVVPDKQPCPETQDEPKATEGQDQAGGGNSQAARCEGPGLADLEATIAKLEAEKLELRDALMRKAADLDNYRKRVVKEKEEARMFANSELILELIGLIDDFDRAIKSAEASMDWKSLHEGIAIVQKAFLGKLEASHGLKRFESQGQDFDPSCHEALMMEQRPDLSQAVVLEEFMKGYSLHGRVIRPAKVKVGMPGGAPAQTNGGAPVQANGDESPESSAQGEKPQA